MDDWDQLTDLGDCGALLDLPPLALLPAFIADLCGDAAQAALDVFTSLIGVPPISLDFLRP